MNEEKLLDLMIDKALSDAAYGEVGDEHGFELDIESRATGEEITLRVTVERIK